MMKLAFIGVGLWLAASPAQAQNPILAFKIKAACEKDAAALCPDVKPGGGRVLACLQVHADKLSPACGALLPEAARMKDEAEKTGKLPN